MQYLTERPKIIPLYPMEPVPGMMFAGAFLRREPCHFAGSRATAQLACRTREVRNVSRVARQNSRSRRGFLGTDSNSTVGLRVGALWHTRRNCL
jgi:hypothetical protein